MKAIQRAVVFIFLATSCFAQDTARMDQLVQTYVQNKTFMGTVLVARGADVILSTMRSGSSYGLRAAEK